jgi:hypothetical protein
VRSGPGTVLRIVKRLPVTTVRRGWESFSSAVCFGRRTTPDLSFNEAFQLPAGEAGSGPFSAPKCRFCGCPARQRLLKKGAARTRPLFSNQKISFKAN